ncbi:hypothetical protein [Ferrovibrio terrae]|uniref:hypothetical protein n=1 Tax=Ferrovibrio terrae TaxID=2594003 RepID=UPI003137A8FD
MSRQTPNEDMVEAYVLFLRKLPKRTNHVYFTGLHASGEWCAAARKAMDRGFGALVQRRVMNASGATMFEYVFQRNGTP